MKQKNKSPFDKIIFPAICISALLFVVQLWGWIALPVWVLALPLLIASGIIVLIMIFAFSVYLMLGRNKNDK